jgi:hypothetical protein
LVADTGASPRFARRSVLSATSGSDGRPLVADVGAGTGLLARLVEQQGVSVAAYDPRPPAVSYHPVEPLDADALSDSYDAVIVSWMEAGKDYRAPIAELSPLIVNAYDVEGGCGVMGATDFKDFGYQVVETWRTASFEDALHALEHRGLKRAAYPGNRIDVLTRKPHLVDPVRVAIDGAKPGRPYAWEPEMDALGL